MENESILYKNNSLQKKITKTIVLFGLNGVGKTSLLLQLTKNRFENKYQTTIGVNFYMKEFENITLSIWDTCGDEMEMQILPPHLYKQSSCFILVCSYNSIESLNSINNFIEYIKSHIEKVKNKKKKNFIALINKSDCKDKKFNLEFAFRILRENNPNILVAEISCKNSDDVLEFFNKICDLLEDRDEFNYRYSNISLNDSQIRRRGNTIFYSGGFKINNHKNEDKIKKKCC